MNFIKKFKNIVACLLSFSFGFLSPLSDKTLNLNSNKIKFANNFGYGELEKPNYSTNVKFYYPSLNFDENDPYKLDTINIDNIYYYNNAFKFSINQYVNNFSFSVPFLSNSLPKNSYIYSFGIFIYQYDEINKKLINLTSDDEFYFKYYRFDDIYYYCSSSKSTIDDENSFIYCQLDDRNIDSQDYLTSLYGSTSSNSQTFYFNCEFSCSENTNFNYLNDIFVFPFISIFTGNVSQSDYLYYVGFMNESLYSYFSFIAHFYYDNLNLNYNNGFDSGYYSGYERGIDEGFDQGYSSGKEFGYNNGYEVGYNKGISSNETPSSFFLNIFSAVVGVPISILNNLNDIVFWNVSLLGIFITLLFFALILWLIRKFI